MPPRVPHRLIPASAPAGGSALLTALLTVTVLSFLAANVLLSVSSRYNSAYRSASWNEALVTAEAGADVVAADIMSLVPSVVPGVNSLGSGYSQPPLNFVNSGNNKMQIDPTGAITISSLQVNPAGLVTKSSTLNIQAWESTHGGEGSTKQKATVLVDVLPLSTLMSGGSQAALDLVKTLAGGGDVPLLRLRSTGTVYLTGGSIAGPSRQDNDLWRVSLLTDPSSGAALSQPQVSRQIEMNLRPVYAADSAVASNDSLHADDPRSIFDSFNSAANGLTAVKYDSLQRGTNATVRANGAKATLGGKVYGNVDTNGGNVAQDSHVTGTVNNASYCPLPVVAVPTWSNAVTASSVTGSTVLPAGTPLLPAQYRFTGISGSLHITRGFLGIGTNVEIFVDGDIRGGIEIDPGITAKVYVSGSVETNASRLQNDTGVAANLQIYGVPSSTGGTRDVAILLDASLCASIYAPLHDVVLNCPANPVDVFGAAVGATVAVNGPVRFHYDEALAYSARLLVRYQSAGWRETTSN